MRKNYFAKLVKYMNNVYNINHGLNKLSDGRVNPTYSTGQVILPVLVGFLLRIKSFNELNLMIKNHEFRQLFPRGTKLPQVDAIRDTLKVIDIDGIKQIIVHGGNAVEAVLYLIFMASNIMQLFLVRRLRNHFTTQREMVRLLLKGLYQLKYQAELVFSSA